VLLAHGEDRGGSAGGKEEDETECVVDAAAGRKNAWPNRDDDEGMASPQRDIPEIAEGWP
jgi:hypothetical protein